MSRSKLPLRLEFARHGCFPLVSFLKAYAQGVPILMKKSDVDCLQAK
ncbi:MAG: hypothetical protein ACR2QJ_17305 [Geminicoccaceae bacterium]